MRFFTGFGLSGISVTSMVLCIEWVDIKHRTAVCILMSLDWTSGAALLPLVTYFVNDWRYLIAIATAPLPLAMICWWWLPESARWLISNGKVNSAHFHLSKCAKVNGREQFMADIKPEILSKAILVENENRKYSYLDLVRTPRMRRLALLTGVMWFGLTCIYYGITFNITGFGVNIYLKAFVFFTLSKIGRRWNDTGMLFLTGLCIFCNMFVPQDKRPFRTALGALGKMFAEASFATVFLHTTELYPTVMRQNGLGYCSFIGHIGVSVSPLIILLEEVWGHLPSTIFSLMAVAAGLSASFLPETHNIRLLETIEDVEHTRKRSISASDEKFQS
ncbi:solute carrier family 22 member 7-like [Sebastes fasciatus]|uniref:solute carrier family 22 member 7-like n=1 Tax=Sebastes fasciatus TaxID=394691 RepID=UPI003D9F8773